MTIAEQPERRSPGGEGVEEHGTGDGHVQRIAGPGRRDRDEAFATGDCVLGQSVGLVAEQELSLIHI